jgi:hypothetical protein
MFGYRGGETVETVQRKRGYGAEARAHWIFLTQYDISTIKNEEQLSAMIKIRSGISETAARDDVAAWMAGKQF